ncbi:MAG: AAA family ATPase [Planctomycetaceae bacterium]|nr:AAA family ATPase [Planctomycetaceae bacterium]
MIERLYVHNFRGLDNFTLDLGDRSSALLIGKNGAGKSTVLQSIKLFQSICRGSGRVGKLISETDFTQNRIDQPMRFELDLILNEKQFKYEIAFEWPDGFREARILDESLSRDGTAVFTRHQAQVQIIGGSLFGLDWHVFGLPVINEPQGRSIQDVKTFFATMLLTAPIPANMSGFSEEPSVELQYDAKNIASCIRGLLEQKPAGYSIFDRYIKAIIPDFSSIEYVSRGERGKQLVVRFQDKESHQNLSVEFKSLSDGEKCFFLSAYIIASNAVGSPVICIWDEPDNHLSLSQVGYFITDLRKMSSRGGQFIATSHHPETIRKFSDETTLVLARRSHFEPTVVRPLAEFNYDGDLVNALIRDEILG